MVEVDVDFFDYVGATWPDEECPLVRVGAVGNDPLMAITDAQSQSLDFAFLAALSVGLFFRLSLSIRCRIFVFELLSLGLIE